jgi:flagellar basal body P-ring formation chaperone FlgA
MRKQQLSQLLTIAIALSSIGAVAQSACPAGYRVLAHRYDTFLQKTWEFRQDCAHPAWPAHSVAIADSALLAGNATSLPLALASAVPPAQPLLVRAGESVRLWSQDAASRIEITGIAEQSAHLGERINIRITHQTDDSGLVVQHIAGIVRAAGNVEIAQ